MNNTKHKYVRLKKYNQIIFFPQTLNHSDFNMFDLISAGYCYLDNEDNKIRCFGESLSLGIGSLEEDSELATKQVYGYE